MLSAAPVGAALGSIAQLVPNVKAKMKPCYARTATKTVIAMLYRDAVFPQKPEIIQGFYDPRKTKVIIK